MAISYDLRGRCEEAVEDFAEAEKYKTAVEDSASQRVEAIQRLANLLRGPLKQADEADRIIDKMVSDDPENDQVYLARGRYRRRFGLPGADADFRRVLKSTNGAEVYLELAELAAAGSNFDEARRVLQSGLAVCRRTRCSTRPGPSWSCAAARPAGPWPASTRAWV